MVYFEFCISCPCLYLSSSACAVVCVVRSNETLGVSYTVNRVGFSSADVRLGGASGGTEAVTMQGSWRII